MLYTNQCKRGLLMRKTAIILMAMALLVPAAALAASGPIATGSELNLGEAQVAATGDLVRTVTVPLIFKNDPVIIAMDIPLSFGQPGDGIELTEVIYSDRIDYFDIKVTNIDNEEKTVVMGLIAMAMDPNTPDLESGDGPIAYLRFEITDNTMESFTIASIVMEQPSHRLMAISHDWSSGNPEIVWQELDLSQEIVLAANVGALPSSYTLDQNYPNPFNAGTVIRFSVPQPENDGMVNVRLSIYNVLGQAVRTLVDEPLDPGFHDVSWDGTSDNGSNVASGIYFYRIQAGTFSHTKKMTLLK